MSLTRYYYQFKDQKGKKSIFVGARNYDDAYERIQKKHPTYKVSVGRTEKDDLAYIFREDRGERAFRIKHGYSYNEMRQHHNEK
jgi:hypothetical protein